MPRIYHCVDDTLDLDRIVVVTDVELQPERVENGVVVKGRMYKFSCFVADTGGSYRAFYLADKSVAEAEHRKLVEAWAGSEIGGLDG